MVWKGWGGGSELGGVGRDCCHYCWDLSKQLLHSFSITQPPRGLNTSTSVCTLLNSDKWAVRGHCGLVSEAPHHRAPLPHWTTATSVSPQMMQEHMETNADTDAHWHMKRLCTHIDTLCCLWGWHDECAVIPGAHTAGRAPVVKHH